MGLLGLVSVLVFSFRPNELHASSGSSHILLFWFFSPAHPITNNRLSHLIRQDWVCSFFYALRCFIQSRSVFAHWFNQLSAKCEVLWPEGENSSSWGGSRFVRGVWSENAQLLSWLAYVMILKVKICADLSCSVSTYLRALKPVANTDEWHRLKSESWGISQTKW